MQRGEKCKMTVVFEVKEAQALALQAMFEYWNKLANWGSSRYVAFYCDGDGDFKPNCQISFDKDVRPLTQEMRDKSVAEKVPGSGEHLYDYDPICWIIRPEAA